MRCSESAVAEAAEAEPEAGVGPGEIEKRRRDVDVWSMLLEREWWCCTSIGSSGHDARRGPMGGSRMPLLGSS
jgi:hypothetical protein